ncbi:MAG: PAS domain-containing protein [Pirellulales bacterium]|nr:PAS domain-containing protein [Pirellulales bacterium]
MRGKRLFWRLFWSYFWIALAALALTAWYGAGSLRQFYLADIDAKLEARARLLIPDVQRFIEQSDFDAVDQLCKQRGKTVDTRITVVLPSGKVIGDTEHDPATMENHAERPEILGAFGGRVGRSIRPSTTLGESLRYVAVPFRIGDSWAAIRTSFRVTALDRSLGVVSSYFFLNAAFAAVLVGLVSLWVSRRISRPLEELEAGAQRLAKGELHHRVQGGRVAEIASLADALNRMAAQWADRVEIILRQQNEQEAMLTSMTEGVLAVDGCGTVITMNPSCARLLGVDAADPRGRTIHEVIRKPELLQFVEAALVDSAPLEREIELIDHETRTLDAHATTLVGAEGKPIGALVILRDVTQLRRLENVRRDFVANVSHELRTPITSIKGFVETLLDGALEDENSARRFLEIIARQVNRLDAIIEDLLMLSRLEKSPDDVPAPQFSTVEIRPMLAGALEMCQKHAEEKQIEIQCQCDPTLAVPMNSHLLEQAVVNLLNNAIKFSEPGTTVHVQAVLEDSEAVIRVKDEGCGIERRHLPRLFERFYRVDKARSRQLGGTGLGLAIVKHIARAHGGTVDVESVVGQGSTFTIRLPGASQVGTA